MPGLDFLQVAGRSDGDLQYMLIPCLLHLYELYLEK